MLRGRTKSPTSSSSSDVNSHFSFSTSLKSRKDSSDEIPTGVIKKKPEQLSPRLFPFDKRSKQISPCSSRDPSPSPFPMSRSTPNDPRPATPPLIRGDQTSSRERAMNRPTPPSPRRKPQFTPSYSVVQLSRRDSDTLESLSEQIGSPQFQQNQQSPSHQSKMIVQYCKQLSRTESNSDSSKKPKQNLKPNLQLDLTLQRDNDSEDEGSHNPPEISPPRSGKSLPLSARQRSNRNLFVSTKTDSPSSQSARSLGSSESRLDDLTSSPSSSTSPSVDALIEYSKTLVQLTSSETIADITKDRVAYANHALRFAQTTLNSPLSASSKRSEEFSEESLYSSLMKSQTLLAHYNPSDNPSAVKESTNHSNTNTHDHNTSTLSSPSSLSKPVKDPQVTIVKQFQSRPSAKFLPRMKSWSPSQSASSAPGTTKCQSKDMKHRPMSSSSRYLTSHSFCDHADVESDSDDEDLERQWRGNGEIKVRPRKTLVKRYTKEISDEVLRNSPEYIQTQLDAMGSDVVYNFEDDFLNE